MTTEDYFNDTCEFLDSVNFEKAITKFIKAIDAFTKAIELNPGCFDSYYIRGHAYSTINKFEEAVNDFTKAKELGPGRAYS